MASPTHTRSSPALLSRLVDRCLERGLIAEPHFGDPTLLQRLLMLRWLTACFLSAPPLLFAGWYALAAFSAHERHVAQLGEPHPLTAGLFQLHLHDHLASDARRLLMPVAGSVPQLPTYNLRLSNDALDQLGGQLPPRDGSDYYVDGHLVVGNRNFPIKTRYRGSKPWHWDHPQKSWKVRVRDGELFEGLATFNFINTPEPMPFDEYLIFGIARERGLLTPDYYPFRLRLNNAYMGVHFFETQADEGLLRRGHRMPGSLFSGSGAPVDPKTGISTLWNDATAWTKVAAYQGHDHSDLHELSALLQVINRGTPQEFADFARDHLDLQRFADFDSFDVVFGVDEHDFDQNHKLYLDPYRGRFEPIMWDFRGGKHSREFNRVENPLLIRLKQLPEYISLRNRAVYELVTGSCAPEAIAQRTDSALEMLRPAQETDPFWDATELLPKMGDYYRDLVRPMTLERQSRAVRRRLDEWAERSLYLREALTTFDLQAVLLPAPSPPLARAAEGTAGAGASESRVRAFDVSVGGFIGYELVNVIPTWPQACRPAQWSLYADSDLSDGLEVDRDRLVLNAGPTSLEASVDERVYPGVTLRARTPSPRRGNVESQPSSNRYRYFVVSRGCDVQGLTLQARSLVTTESRTVAARPAAAAQRTATNASPCGGGFAFEPGQASEHPWCARREPDASIQLGPGVVRVDATRVFAANESVHIAAGTEFRMADGASLVFLGPLKAIGSSEAPIRFLPQGQRWGGVALQGPGTRGSRLQHVELRQGTLPHWSLNRFTGLLDIRDTADISIGQLAIADNSISDDALHVADVRELSVKGIEIRRAQADGIDLEFVTGTLSGVTVTDSGDDAIDLMESAVQIDAARLIRFAGNGVSAGEETNARLDRVFIAQGGRGILIKNASRVELGDVLVYRAAVGLRVESRSQWYRGRSQLAGDAPWLVRCGQAVDYVGSPSHEPLEVIKELTAAALPDLRRDLLGLATWSDLDPFLNATGRGEASVGATR